MGGKSRPDQSLCAAAAALALLCAAPLLGGCAVNSYAGIPFAAGTADPEIQALAGRAKAGDKQAQFELGTRYEEGRGLPVDLSRARHLYRLAAADSGGMIFIYQPTTRKGGAGQVVPVDTGPVQKGLPEARLHLADIAPSRKPDAAIGTGPMRPPSAAIIEEAYTDRANWLCAFLIDVCPDDALVLPDTVNAEKIECAVKSDRAACSFDIVRFGNRERCRSTFKLEQHSGEQSWVVETEHGRQGRFKPKIKCQSS